MNSLLFNQLTLLMGSVTHHFIENYNILYLYKVYITGLLSWGHLLIYSTILLICVVLFSCYHCEAALVQSVL